MNSVQLSIYLALVLLGGAGVFEGLSHLSTSPLPAVLVILSAMGFLLFPTARLCGTEVVGSRRLHREKSRREERAE